MAAGRIINSVICKDKKVSELSDDTCRLAFTWLLTFADKEGRTYGDPSIVRSMLFPRRDDFTNTQMEKYIAEWQEKGMVFWYEVDGDKYISFPNFEKNQPNLRKDREAESIIPPAAEGIMVVSEYVEQLRSNDGVNPEKLPVKLSKVKLKEVPAKKPAGNLFQIAHALSIVSGMDFEKNKGRLFRVSKNFKPGDENQILTDYGQGDKWYKFDWRGQKNKKPTPEQVLETWNNLIIPEDTNKQKPDKYWDVSPDGKCIPMEAPDA